MKKMLFFVIMVVFSVGCRESRRDQLKELGLFGQHNLRWIEQTSGFNGHMESKFFLGTGSESGSMVAERKLQFYWGRTDDEFISTTLPYSHFRFIVDESKSVPTVEFIFDERYLRKDVSVYTDSEKSNLNWWLDDESVRKRELRVAVVRISRKNLEKEVYLPRPNDVHRSTQKLEKE